MNIDFLREAAKNIVIGPKEIADLKKRMEAAELKFEKEERNRAITQEFLDRTYSL